MKLHLDSYLTQNERNDIGYALFMAFEDCRIKKASSLTIEPGVYHVYPDHLAQKLLFITNNSYGLKRVALSLTKLKDFTLEAQGVEFLFHGEIMPVCIEDCENVTVRGLSIDYAHPLFGQGKILASTDESLDIAIDQSLFPYVIHERKLCFETTDWKSGSVHNILEVDEKKLEPAYTAGDYWCDDTMEAEELSAGVVRLKQRFRRLFKPGNLVALAVESRKYPGILITRSSQVRIKNVNIYQAWGMALVGQHSSDIHLDGYHVKTREGSPYFISAIADATHFVHCMGQVLIENCVMERQMDDPVNCHGIYTTIDAIINESTVLLRLNHPEQLGVDIYEPGDEIVFLERGTLKNNGARIVKSCQFINVSCIKVVLETSIPKASVINDVVDNPYRMNELIIRNCHMGANRARGPLLSSPKKILMENNLVYSAGPGVLVAGGEASYWYESGAVNDVTIRGNTFKNCLYGPWGQAVVLITTERQIRTDECFHRNIVIEDNVFHAFDPAIVFAQNVDGLVFRNNQIIQNSDYSPYNKAKSLITLDGTMNVVTGDNNIVGFQNHPLQ